MSNRIQTFLENWNGIFTECQLTVDDLKKPHALMEALFNILEKLGIDKDAMLDPPEEAPASSEFYRDLIPVITMMRTINHLLTDTTSMREKIVLTHFLQPSVETSYIILMLLFNLMLFNEERLAEIAPKEAEEFAKTDKIKALEEHRNNLLSKLNDQAELKGKRAQNLEKIDADSKQYEEELKIEKENHDKEKKILDALQKESHQREMLIEQKKSHYDTIITELNRKKALRVYDADDVKAQVEQASQNVQKVEEKLEALKGTLEEKENCLKNLQIIKPSLDSANNLLHEIIQVSENIKELECGDLDSESLEGQLEMLNIEQSELRCTNDELQASAAHVLQQASAASAARERGTGTSVSLLRKTEEEDKMCRERSDKAAQRTQQIQQDVVKYEQEKLKGLQDLQTIKQMLENEVMSIEKQLLNNTLQPIIKTRFVAKMRDHVHYYNNN